jgi:hypothetical protein
MKNVGERKIFYWLYNYKSKITCNMYFIFIKGIKGYSYDPNILNAKPKSKFMMVALDIFR